MKSQGATGYKARDMAECGMWVHVQHRWGSEGGKETRDLHLASLHSARCMAYSGCLTKDPVARVQGWAGDSRMKLHVIVALDPLLPMGPHRSANIGLLDGCPITQDPQLILRTTGRLPSRKIPAETWRHWINCIAQTQNAMKAQKKGEEVGKGQMVREEQGQMSQERADWTTKA